MCHLTLPVELCAFDAGQVGGDGETKQSAGTSESEPTIKYSFGELDLLSLRIRFQS